MFCLFFVCIVVFFFFNDTATTEIYTLSLHDALPICLLTVDESGLYVPPDARPLARMIARSFDAYELSSAGHSSAI